MGWSQYLLVEPCKVHGYPHISIGLGHSHEGVVPLGWVVISGHYDDLAYHGIQLF